MTIASWGYTGSVYPNDVWARMQWVLGCRYMVHDADHAKLVPGNNRQVSIGGGYIGGAGILDRLGDGTPNTSEGPLTLPVVASGTKWFLIVARRTWGADGPSSATTLVAIDAGASPTIPVRNTNAGALDDQPLWLVPLAAGASAVGTPIDLRVIGNGGPGVFIANSELVLTYMAQDGVAIRIGTDQWQRKINTDGSRSWDKTGGGRRALEVLTGASVVASVEKGWSSTGRTSYATRDGNRVQLEVDLRHETTKISTGSSGGLSDIKLCTLQAALCPDRRMWVMGAVAGGDDEAGRGSYTGMFSIDPAGAVYLCWMSPSTVLHRGTKATDYTIQFLAEFTQAAAS